MSVFNYDFFTDRYQAIQSVGIVDHAFQLLKHGYGVIERVPTVDHPREDNGWIRVLSANQFACGNWETYRGAFFSDEKLGCLSELDRRKLVMETNAKLQKELLERERRYKDTAGRALTFWKLCDSINLSDLHPYLKRKQVKPVLTIRESTAQRFKDYFGYFPKVEKGRLLVIPLRDEVGLASLQIITEDGTKVYLAGGRMSSCYWQSDRAVNPEYIAIGEGVATVLSFIQHRPEKILGVSAMNAGNLPKVAKAIRRRFSESTIIIVGDNDPKSGTGQRFATQAQESISGKTSLLIPTFTAGDKILFKLITDSQKEPTDFNDRYLLNDYLNKFMEVYQCHT